MLRIRGSIDVGKQADLMVVSGNPATKISDIENVEIVFKWRGLRLREAESECAGVGGDSINLEYGGRQPAEWAKASHKSLVIFNSIYFQELDELNREAKPIDDVPSIRLYICAPVRHVND